MRRSRRGGRANNKGRLRLLALLASAALAVRLVAALDANTLQEYAEYEARAATTQLMQDAVAAQMRADPDTYRGLYTIDRGADGSPQAVQSDLYAANAARAALVGAVAAALEAVPEQEIRVPIGSMLGSVFLSGHGPACTVTVCPRGYVDGSLQEQVSAVGINRAEYRLDLRLTTAVNMILDGRTHVLTVSMTVPLAHVLLDGAVPDYYGG